MQPSNLSALAWGLLAIPIIGFYILKVRLRRVPVPTLMFWSRVFEDRRPRSLWQKLRHLVSLAVQLLFLSLLVGALADPLLTSESSRPRRIVLVVDHSASMNAAAPGEPPPLAQARIQGLRLIRSLRARDEMAIIAAASAARVQSSLTSHQRTLADALVAIKPTDCPTRLAPAVALAGRLVAGHPNARIVVVTDGRADALAELRQAGDVRVVTVGRPLGNAGITRFQVRRSLIDPIGYQILVEVTNASDAPVECRLEVELRGGAEDSGAPGELVDVIPLALEAGATWTSVLDHASAEGGQLVASLDHADPLEADNRAYALLPRRTVQKVTLVVAEPDLFLERALDAIPLVELTVTDTAPGTVEPGSVVVFHRQAPPRLPPAHVLVIEPATSSELWTLGEVVASPLVTDQSDAAPLMTHVQLENVFMPDARQLELAPGHDVLAASLDGAPVYCSWNRPQGKVLLLNVNLAKGDLPLRTAFPIMMANAMAWFQGTGGELREAQPAGSRLDLDLRDAGLRAAGVQPAAHGPAWVLRSPDGIERPIPSGKAGTTIGPLDRVGVWSVRPRAEAPGAALEIACNLASREESDLRQVIESRGPETLEGGWLGGLPVWFYLAAAALVLVVAEWFLYQRRWIG